MGEAMKPVACVLLGLSLVTASAGTQVPGKPQAQESQNAKTAVKSNEASAISANDPTYKIGPQDLLRIDVWKEPEISRAVPVRPDGKISLPLLNDVQAAGLSPMELSKVIAEGLKNYINNPEVTVGVTEINSRRIYVAGEVSRPGAYPLLPNMTVLQALTSAGGFTAFARLKGIYVLRTEHGRQVKHPFNYREVINGKKPEDNIQLQPADTVVVP
jgi:polysaccharide biosynthesis/export protein